MEIQEGRRPRRGKIEAIEGETPPAPIDPIVSDTETPAVETPEIQTAEGRRRRASRRPDAAIVEARVGSTVKLSIRLPVLTWWRLKHLMADTPGKTEGEVIAPLLDQYLGGFDYPKRPDWLLSAMKGENPTQETSAA